MVCDCFIVFFFFQAEDGIRDLVRSRGLGDVYKRQAFENVKRAGELPGGRPACSSKSARKARIQAKQRLSLIHI